MHVARHHEIACAVIIDTRGRFLFQRRDDVAGILHPGKVGLFGGHREGDETFLECVVREIREEISYPVPPTCFQYLASFDGPDIDTGGSVRGEFFITRDIPADALVITEGSLLIVKRNEIIEIERELTPTARFAIRALLDQRMNRD